MKILENPEKSQLRKALLLLIGLTKLKMANSSYEKAKTQKLSILQKTV